MLSSGPDRHGGRLGGPRRPADRIGRRPTMLGCLVVMASGMYLASFATSVADLRMWRLITGLGIGGMLATINAVAAEYSSLAGATCAYR
ncbi:MAG: MFS transporter [Steroidobacteraceae bacterium]